MSSQRLAGKIALVTGAAKGIGEAIAVRFGAEGASVIVNDINGEGAEAVAAAINAAGGEAIAVAADISKEDQVDSMFAQLLEKYGTLDVLVNNAGLISPFRHFLEIDKEYWDRFIGVNLSGTFLCAMHASKIMAQKGAGSIINLSSGGATKAHRGFAAYDAAKGGIEALTRAMCLDLGPYGVRINSLIPGSIDTSGLSLEDRKMRGVNVPLERIGEPKDMAGAAVFLASDDAAYVTGQRLVVDGGMLAQQRSATVDIFPPAQYPKIDRD